MSTVKEKYASKLTKNDLINFDTVTTKQGIPVLLGMKTVGASEGLILGNGQYKSLESATGRIYAVIKDDTDADVDGLLRLSYWTPQNRSLKVLTEIHTSDLKSGATSKADQTPLPQFDYMIGEDYKLVAEFISEGDAETITKANCELDVSITKATVI